MKIAVVLNGTETKKTRYFKRFHPLLSNNHEITIFETLRAGDGVHQTMLALDKNPDVILAAGGDGTLNQVTQAILKNNSRIPIAIAPLGTGNDFAAFAGIKNVHDLIYKLSADPVPTDVGLVNGFDSFDQTIEKYFINVASIGLGPDVAHYLEKSTRALGSDLTYVLNSIRAFLNQIPFEVEALTNEWKWNGKIRALAVANGRHFGSGLHIAPGAKADDGLFSIFIAGDVPLHEFLFFLMKIKSGKKIEHQKAIYESCNSIAITGPQGAWVETDGELALKLPARFTILPSAVQFFR